MKRLMFLLAVLVSTTFFVTSAIAGGVVKLGVDEVRSF